MLRLALSTLSARKSGVSGAFAAVVLSVVLVVSCGILLESSLRAPIPVERLGGAAVVVQADSTLQPQDGRGNLSVPLTERARVPEGLATRLKELPGVRDAIADRSFSTDIIADGRALTGAEGAPPTGHGWQSASLTPFALTSGTTPRRVGDVVLDDELATQGSVHLGDRIRIGTATGRQDFRVVGIASAADADGSSRRPSVFFRDDVAVRLSGTGGRADLIGIVTEPGADAQDVADHVRGALDQPALRVLTGASRGEAESPEDVLSREDIVAGLTIFAVLAAFVALFVVAGTFALSVQRRHRELALLRAIGCTSRQVRKMVAAEALVVAVLAALVGGPLSLAFVGLERNLFARADIVPGDLNLVVGWVPFAAGLVIAIVTTQLAAFVSARRASRINPTDTLREATVQPRPVSWLRGMVGLAVLVGGIAILIASAHGAGGSRGELAPIAALVCTLAAALLAPLLVVPFVWLLGAPLAAVSRGPGMLARANTRANLRRAASVAIPLMLTVSLAFTMVFVRMTLERETGHQAAQSVSAEHVLRAPEADGLTPDIAAQARRVPGVAQASGTFPTSIVAAPDGANLRSFPARAVDASTLESVVDLGVTSGSLADLHGAALAAGAETARTSGWHTGDRVRVWLGDGTPATLRVAAIYDRPLGFGEIVVPRALVERHVTDPLDDAVLVEERPRRRRAPGRRRAGRSRRAITPP